jgi:hypothetical protein
MINQMIFIKYYKFWSVFVNLGQNYNNSLCGMEIVHLYRKLPSSSPMLKTCIFHV